MEEAGAAAGVVTRAAAVSDADLAGAVVFIDGEKALTALAGKRFALCFAPAGDAEKARGMGGPVVGHRNPRGAFARVAAALHEVRRLDDDGLAPSIAESARIHDTAIIGPGAEIGEGADIGPYAVIGPGVRIGARSIVAERASLWCAVVGADCRVGAGSSVGGPGFGFVAGEAGLARIPQLGRVMIGERVEIGSNVCIDRGMLDDTSIGSGTKIDNIVHIGHNVRIGEHCAIVAMVGIAGSVVIGSRVQIGGHAGIADHLTIGDDARIGAKAGLTRDVPAGETWAGYPARPMNRWMRETATLARLVKKKKAADNDR
ncbi:MAG: UDP-3-O-(3-hydroxymyristoyl)glucosamine N-acyltransferase [Parvularculaceae bacterium]|nr:UDP-3-O-(3-hydroxymyristoyl)glucosamine N-acyltransferase [Parvularculaceae bacterium]